MSGYVLYARVSPSNAFKGWRCCPVVLRALYALEPLST